MRTLAGGRVALGDAFGEEVRRLVFELYVPGLAALGPARITDVVLRYVSVGEEQVAAHELTLPLVVNLVSTDEAAAAQVDAEVTEEVVVLLAARAQAEAREHAERGSFDVARKLLADGRAPCPRTGLRQGGRVPGRRPTSWTPRRG